MDDPGLDVGEALPNWVNPSVGKGVHVYKGGIKFEFVADMVKSSLIAQSFINLNLKEVCFFPIYN
jgi:hypothetical protein